MLGWRPQSEYPFPSLAAGSQDPERVYCLDGEPVVAPHGTCRISYANYGVTLTEGASFGGGPTYRRWWFSAPATNRANIATISNDTARPLEVILIVQAGQTFNWWKADWEGEIIDPTFGSNGVSNEIVARYDVGVLEGSLGSNPQMSYAPYGTDAAVFQVNPTLEATHTWSKVATGGSSSQEYNTASQMVMGKLPLLQPGRKYVAEPSIFIDGGETNTVADLGTYTAARMWFTLMAWSSFD